METQKAKVRPPHYWFPCALGKDLTLSPHARAVLHALLSHADKDRRCCPSRATIKKLTGYGKDRITEAITELKRRGLIETTQARKVQGRFELMTYRIAEFTDTVESPARLSHGDGDDGNPPAGPEV